MDHREPEIRAEHGAAAGQLHLALPRPLLSGHPGRPQDRAHNLLKIKFEWKIIKKMDHYFPSKVIFRLSIKAKLSDNDLLLLQTIYP